VLRLNAVRVDDVADRQALLAHPGISDWQWSPVIALRLHTVSLVAIIGGVMTGLWVICEKIPTFGGGDL
jgi:hypothetical protein